MDGAATLDGKRKRPGRWGRRRLLAAGATGLTLVTMAAIVFAVDRSRSALTEVLHTTCDIGGSDADIALPLDLLRAASRNLPLRVGPLDGAAAEPGISLEFRPATDGEDGVHRYGQVISLPMLEDARGRLPRRVVLSCREGRVAAARYEWRDGSRRDLPVPVGD